MKQLSAFFKFLVLQVLIPIGVGYASGLAASNSVVSNVTLKIDQIDSRVRSLSAQTAKIENLESEYANLKKVKADAVQIQALRAEIAEVRKLTSEEVRTSKIVFTRQP